MISAVATRTLPGIRFTAEAPKLREVLPRMDIAAFVGFASAGPVNTPVPIEDIGRFRDVFGPDLPLAWDPSTGRQAYAQLGKAVEAFFLNGGRRCWVVRVNGAEVAYETSPPLAHGGQTQRFEIPGLVSPTGIRAVAAARSSGSWADALRVGATLRAEGLLVDDFTQLEVSPPDPARFVAEIKSPTSGLQAGDMIRLAFADVDGPSSPPDALPEEPKWLGYLAVEDTRQAASANRVLAKGPCMWYRADARTEETSDPYVSPPESVLPQEPSVAELDGLLAAGPIDGVRLTFDLLVWRDHHLQTRLEGLGFTKHHPRFWGGLPSDEAIFKLGDGRPQKPEAGNLEAEVFDPRFPLAAPKETSGTWIPVGMSTRDDPDNANEPLLDADPDTALTRDGLEHFSPDLFLDPNLKNEHSRNLVAKARKHLLEDPPHNKLLLGIHSLYPIDEVTLLSVPDASHRAWNLRAVKVPQVLPAPVLRPVQPPDDRGVYDLSWTRVFLAEEPFGEVASYVLEESTRPDFEDARVVYRGSDVDTGLKQPTDCSRRLFYRVRAQEDERISAWSNTESTIVPPAEFIDCVQPPAAPVIELIEPDGSPPGHSEKPVILWAVGDFDPDTVFRVERAFDPAFEKATRIPIPQGKTQYAMTETGGLDYFFASAEKTKAAVSYYRVRADKPLGPWSNTVAQDPTKVSVIAYDDPSAFDAGPLLDVHRALLRFCAARGDMMAILNVPRHYRPDLTLAHKGALTPVTSDDVFVATEAATTTVGPLTADEEHALSYGALFHPWVQQRFAGSESLRFIFSPPDGTVVGLMAEMAVRRGAWIAPANRTFKGVTATAPSLSAEDLTLLFSGQVNPVALDPQGFAALAAETLSPDDSLRQINVRRLLILLRRIVQRAGPTFVFEPNSDALRRLIHAQFDAILSDLFLRGALAGSTADEAYQIVSDRSINTQASIDRGRLVIEIKIAPARPLVYITVRLVQTGVDGLRLEEV